MYIKLQSKISKQTVNRLNAIRKHKIFHTQKWIFMHTANVECNDDTRVGAREWATDRESDTEEKTYVYRNDSTQNKEILVVVYLVCNLLLLSTAAMTMIIPYYSFFLTFFAYRILPLLHMRFFLSFLLCRYFPLCVHLIFTDIYCTPKIHIARFVYCCTRKTNFIYMYIKYIFILFKMWSTIFVFCWLLRLPWVLSLFWRT